jgi:ABC-type transport system involved in multi-copper enzyme maturation permease subunit
MYWNLLWIENQKNFRRRLLWVELAILIIFILLIFMGLYISIRTTPDGVTITDTDRAKLPQLVTWPGSLAFSLRFAAGSKLLLIIFVGAVVASEYSWRTYQLWLSRGIPRFLLILAKFTALIMPTLIVVIGALLVGGCISAIFSYIINGSLFLEQINLWRLGLDVFRTAYTLLPYVSITFLLAIISRSAVAAIGGCTAFGLVLENLLGQTLLLLPSKLGNMAFYLPASLMESVLSASWTPPALVEDMTPGLLSPGQAGIGIAIWTVVLLGTSMWLFQRQDFSG